MTIDLFSTNDPIGDDAGLSRAERDRYGDRTAVLDKVKALRFLPDGLHLTTELVADYYEVSIEAIKKLVQRNREEMEANGFRVLTGSALADMKSISGVRDNMSLTRSLAVFNRRAVVRVGLLLRDSEVARRVRDAVQDGYEATALPDLSDPLLALQQVSSQLSQAVTLALAERRRAEVAESTVRRLVPAASAWETFRATGATLEVGVAAKYLAQHGVNTGRNRLYATLRELGWVFKRSCEPVGKYVERGFVEVEAGATYVNGKTQQVEQAKAHTRITADGLERLAEHFGVALDHDLVSQYFDLQDGAA